MYSNILVVIFLVSVLAQSARTAGYPPQKCFKCVLGDGQCWELSNDKDTSRTTECSGDTGMQIDPKWLCYSINGTINGEEVLERGCTTNVKKCDKVPLPGITVHNVSCRVCDGPFCNGFRSHGTHVVPVIGLVAAVALATIAVAI